MRHKQFKQWLQLYLYDELSDGEKHLLEDHLKTCPDCEAELEELKKFHTAVSHHRRVAISHQTLTDARRRLRLALGEKLSQQPLWERLIEPIYKISFGGIATLAVGFVIGYMMSSAPQLESVLGSKQEEVGPVLEGDSRITNVRFMDADASDGEVEFTFDLVRPVRLKGKMNDPQIQKVLAHALVSSQNAGVRLRTVNVLSGQEEPLQTEELRTALLEVITNDPNPAIRKEALTLLQKLPFSNDMKDAVLYALRNDQNSGVRIAAIMVLDQFKEHIINDPEVLKVLQEKIQSDENNYIRLVARNFFEEKQQ